ncbi:pyrophosphate-energised proton pump, partial [Baffinella frigidus]
MRSLAAVLLLASVALTVATPSLSDGAPLGTPAGPPGDTQAYASLFVFVCGAVGVAFAAILFLTVSQISLKSGGSDDSESLLASTRASDEELETIYETIRAGAQSFLWAEYQICAIFVVAFGILVFVLTSHVTDAAGVASWDWSAGGLTAVSFVVGAGTSIIAGYIGMMVAVYANARTTISAKKDGEAGWRESFNCAFRAGGVMGFSLCSISLVILYLLCIIYKEILTDKGETDYKKLFECVAGYGLGGSSIAMFGRVGGGIFTKAADVGADLSGKVIGVGEGKKLDEDSPYNPACIADNVGDNVGDVAGMGSDLFGSFGEASCAAMLIGSASPSIISEGWAALVFPLFISGVGIIACLICSFVATNLQPVRKESDIERNLKIQLGLTSLAMTVLLAPLCHVALPDVLRLTVKGQLTDVSPMVCYLCIVAGLWGGCLIGFITEYYTSHSYKPVREVARATETGAATNIIYGLALGYQSAILPVMILSAIIFLALTTAGMYGVALSALGMLSTLATCLTIDVYGPISDNAGGIAEMTEMPSSVRDKTDALDAAGNTTAAIGKGFAIGSAALVSLALFGAFVTRVSADPSGKMSALAGDVNLLSPIVFASLIFGAMVPYWFSAMTMKSVGEAANAMVKEVARQWAEIPGLSDSAGLDFHERQEWRAQGRQLVKPDYQTCIAIATTASLREMVPPGALVILTPIIVGTLFGVEAVCGLLTGAVASSVQLAISMSNTGGAWDNSKKYTEKGELNGYFPYRDGRPIDEATWKAAAEQHHGDACMTQRVQMGGAVKQVPIKQWLSDLEKTAPAQYKKVMNGEQFVMTVDGRKCLYSGKKSQAHAAAVVGDTVGDPLKDTSGPALNIVMKLMAIISVVTVTDSLSSTCGAGCGPWRAAKRAPPPHPPP